MSLASVFSSFTRFHSDQSYSERFASGTQAGSEAALKGRAKPVSRETELALSYSKQEQFTYGGAVTKNPAPSSVEASERTPAANNILNFLSLRLRADFAEGVDSEVLSARLEAGLEGFIDGFQQAYDQLSEMNFLYPEVEAAIETTFSDVLSGIGSLAEELGVESPINEEVERIQADRQASFVADETPESSQSLLENSERVDALVGEQAQLSYEYKLIESTSILVKSEQAKAIEIASVGDVTVPLSPPSSPRSEPSNFDTLVESSAYQYDAQQSQTFDFALTTQDGDTVKIKAAFATNSLLQGEEVVYGGGDTQSFSGTLKVANGFYLDIQGELDESELLAIEDLLTQVREISDLFFSGDLQSAFNKALDLGFNSDEIAEFSLKLRYQSSVRYQEQSERYYPGQLLQNNEIEKFKQLATEDSELMLLTRFVQALEDMRVRAEEVGVLGKGLNGAGNSNQANLDETQLNTEKNRAGPVATIKDLLTSLDKLSQA